MFLALRYKYWHRKLFKQIVYIVTCSIVNFMPTNLFDDQYGDKDLTVYCVLYSYFLPAEFFSSTTFKYAG